MTRTACPTCLGVGGQHRPGCPAAPKPPKRLASMEGVAVATLLFLGALYVVSALAPAFTTP